MQVVNSASSDKEEKSEVMIVRVEPSRKAKAISLATPDYTLSDMVRDGLDLIFMQLETQEKKAS